MFYEEIRIRSFLHIILSIKDSLQQQIHYNGNIFGNKCCRCNEGSLYMSWPRGYKTFFMLNSAEHEILSANKYENASNSLARKNLELLVI